MAPGPGTRSGDIEQPILLRVESGGHGIGQSLDQEVGMEADVFAFVAAQLAVDPSRAGDFRAKL